MKIGQKAIKIGHEHDAKSFMITKNSCYQRESIQINLVFKIDEGSENSTMN